jgi:hypothetical protein
MSGHDGPSMAQYSAIQHACLVLTADHALQMEGR